MIKHERLNLMPFTDEYYFSIRSEYLDEDISFAIENKICNIRLNDTYEFLETNLSKIERINVKKLYIHPHSKNKFSYSGLSSFKNLEYLVIHNDRADEIDLSCNTEIKYLCIGNCSELHGLKNLSKLESLTMTKPRQEHLSIIETGSLFNLKKLFLYDSPMIQGFSFLLKSKIEDVLIHNIKSVDFTNIDSCHLNSLRIEKCKVIQGVESVLKCKSLTELYIIDSFDIATAKDLDYLDKLKVLVVMGSSVIKDGDLSPLKGRLNHFGFDNKRHYSIKYEKFKDEFLKR